MQNLHLIVAQPPQRVVDVTKRVLHLELQNNHFSINNHHSSGAILHSFCIFNRKNRKKRSRRLDCNSLYVHVERRDWPRNRVVPSHRIRRAGEPVDAVGRVRHADVLLPGQDPAVLALQSERDLSSAGMHIYKADSVYTYHLSAGEPPFHYKIIIFSFKIILFSGQTHIS